MSDSLISGGLGLAGSLIGGSKASKGAREGAQLAQFNPYSIYSGIGSGVFDQKNKTGTASLTAPYQSKRDYYLGQADFFNSQLGQFRPPTRDQFISGYDTSGNRSRQSFYDDLLGSGQFNRNGGDGDAMHYARYGFERPQSLFDAQRQWNVSAGQSGGNINGSGESLADKYINAQDYYEQTKGGKSGTDFDALNAEADRLFNAQGGNPLYDDDAFAAAREGYVSPEQRIYNRLFKLSEGNEALEKSGLESRLFAQGMLGSTGGAHRLNAQADAAYSRQLGREQQAVTLAEEIQNQIQNRGIRATNQALGIDQASLENLRLGIGAGGGNVAAGQITAQNAANQGGAIANAFSSFGDNFSSGGLFGQQGINTFGAPNTDINSITSSFFG